MRTLFFLFLFSFVLHSATIEIIEGIPQNLTGGSAYVLNYSLCLNTAQNYTLNFNMTNTTYNFTSEGIEFSFSNCSYVQNRSLYACPFYGQVGANTIEINLSVNPLIMQEEYIIGGFVELFDEATYGACNAAPVVPAPSSGSSGGSSVSGGGSFYFPRFFPTPEPVEEPEEPIEIPKPIEEPAPVVNPEPVVPEKPPEIKPDITKNASMLVFDPSEPRPEKEYYWEYIIGGGLFSVLVGFLIWWFFLRIGEPPTTALLPKSSKQVF